MTKRIKLQEDHNDQDALHDLHDPDDPDILDSNLMKVASQTIDRMVYFRENR